MSTTHACRWRLRFFLLVIAATFGGGHPSDLGRKALTGRTNCFARQADWANLIASYSSRLAFSWCWERVGVSHFTWRRRQVPQPPNERERREFDFSDARGIEIVLREMGREKDLEVSGSIKRQTPPFGFGRGPLIKLEQLLMRLVHRSL